MPNEKNQKKKQKKMSKTKKNSREIEAKRCIHIFIATLYLWNIMTSQFTHRAESIYHAQLFIPRIVDTVQEVDRTNRTKEADRTNRTKIKIKNDEMMLERKKGKLWLRTSNLLQSWGEREGKREPILPQWLV